MQEVMERPQAAPPALHSEAESLTQAIITIARDPALNIEKMERLMAMHERITSRGNEQRFNEAMAEAQSHMGRVSADAVNPQTRSRYATYAQLDRHLRPIYTASGFSLSFDQADGAPDGFVRVVCYVSNAGHTRTYRCDMPADGKGAKGNDVMTKTHASGAAMSYGMRYLLKLIFNVAIGEDDDDGNNDPRPAAIPAPLLDAARKAAAGGWAALSKHIKTLSETERTQLEPESIALKNAARDADARKEQQA